RAAALDHLYRDAAFAQFERGREAGDAGSDNDDFGSVRHWLPFLRRHDPDQVQSVQLLAVSVRLTGHPSDLARRRLRPIAAVKRARLQSCTLVCSAQDISTGNA